MKRWLMGTFGVALILSIVGCSQPCFLAKEVYDHSHTQTLPPRFENDTSVLSTPQTGLVSAPPDVNSPDRPPRYLTLQEAIAIALESGTASGRNGAGQGVVDDFGLTFSNGANSLNQQTDRIRVLALNPSLVATGMEASLARYDAQWVTSMNWTNTDNLQQGLQSFSNGQGAAFQSSIVKAFSSGGVANVSFLTNYTNLAAPPAGNFTVLNPSYNSSVVIGFEQPVWRDFGTSINQLLGRFPSINGQSMPNQAAAGFNAHQGLIGSNAGLQVEGILISRLRFDQSRAEFERNVQVLLLNVEVAYWKLYQAYGTLYSYEEVLRIAHKAWEINYAKFNIGTIGPANYYPIRGQYEEFRGERVRALNDVLEKERNLRGILGLPIEDGSRVVPITPPTMAEYKPDWDSCLNDALNTKPEIVLAGSLREAWRQGSSLPS